MTENYSARARIEVDGSPLDRGLEPLLERVVVDDHLQLPDMFTITLRDPDRAVLGRARLAIGARVVIAGTPMNGQAPEPLITGELTALEAEYDHAGARVTARGYDHSHRLHRGRHTETYRNATDSDIARTVAQRAGLELGQIDEAPTPHDHVSQANLTDWEFLKARAREIGFEVAVTEGRLHFRQPTPSATAPPEGTLRMADRLQLVYGRNLLEFHPRVTAAEQVGQVEVRGWDPAEKRAVTASASADTTSAQLGATPARLASLFGNPSYVTVDRPLSDQSSADALAGAVAEQIGSAFAEADGMVVGDPRLKAGTAVSVAGIAEEFCGRYTLSHTRHVFDGDGYHTHISISGRQERSLLGLASRGSSNGSTPGGSTINGVVVGIVTANDDPEGWGRVKLRFPWLSDDYESNWARLVQVGAGPQSGFIFVPEVNDEVLVAFEFGDPARPYVVGGLHNGTDTPRLGDGLFDSGRVKRRGVVSRRGHLIVLFDDAGQSGIGLLTGDKKLRFALNETSHEVHLVADGRIRIEATGGIELSSGGDISIEASGQLTLKGQRGAALQSPAPVDIDGRPIQLN